MGDEVSENNEDPWVWARQVWEAPDAKTREPYLAWDRMARVCYRGLTLAPVLAQGISVFCIGVLLAPFKPGAILFILGLAVYEAVLFALAYAGHGPPWRGEFWSGWGRLFIVLASIAGFVVGRWVVGASFQWV